MTADQDPYNRRAERSISPAETVRPRGDVHVDGVRKINSTATLARLVQVG